MQGKTRSNYESRNCSRYVVNKIEYLYYILSIMYLNKLSAVTRKAALEPQKRNDITNSKALFNNCGHWHTSIARFLTCIIIIHPITSWEREDKGPM
jgi:hypothetical protein